MNARHFIFSSLVAFLSLPGVALAHPGHIEAPALLAGLLHPFSGADHLLLMIGVGIWASMLSRRWIGSVAALTAMVLGVLWAATGGALPGLELLLAGSLLVMGGVLVGVLRAVPGLTGMLVMVLAGLHGYAHGVEMPLGTPLSNYVLGLVLASLVLQLSGMTLGCVAKKRLGERRGLLGLPLLATGVWLLLGSA
ncbi:HupE/UreJ family protein [Tepidiphilus succinatimandens]|uniref:HupE/UreJ family protein n=1 Tax=Tepidiphilus succinatimandens TaxID=224436 RepID=UPI00112F6B2F|nr:HupE/UreJ family protein [Tepidiphilus succinatimandens]